MAALVEKRLRAVEKVKGKEKVGKVKGVKDGAKAGLKDGSKMVGDRVTGAAMGGALPPR